MPSILVAIAWALAAVVGVPLVWLTGAKVVRRIYAFPAPACLGRFLDSDFRRRLQPPERIIADSGIAPGMRVLEIGCGSGAYSLFVARAVGPGGSVAALDIQPAMLQQLERKLAMPENQDVTNISLHEGSAYDLPFDDGYFDLVYMITVLPEVPDPARALVEVKRVLKPGGILALSEFLPDPDYPRRATTVRWGEQAGFELEGVFGSLWTYTARFKKPEQEGRR